MAKPTKLKKFKQILWDPNKRQFLGRTKDSWFKLIAFYIALYTCLAAIWMAFFQIFQLTISDHYPKWQLDESLIGTNPGVGFRPQNPPSRIESALIKFKSGHEADVEHWVKDLDQFINNATKTNEKNADIDCNSSNESRKKDAFCPFDPKLVDIPLECQIQQNFSFAKGSPCILLKLNKIYGWVPQPYKTKPANFPAKTDFVPNKIQITCDGQNDPDKEHIGEISYHPNGIDTKHYPYYNQLGYTSPFVMVHFKNPAKNTLIYVECKAWAQNIEHDRFNKRGMTAFELFIEK